MYFDYSYLLLIVPALIITIIAQARVSSTFNKYSAVANARGLTGAQVAQQVLEGNGVSGVSVERVSGSLTDHYDPQTNVIRLSDSVYDKVTVAAAGVAAHEAGHAVQYATNYAPIKWRMAIVPITNIGSSLSIPLILIGLLLSFPVLVYIGIALFSFMVLFQLVTLPVEYNASNRAMRALENSHLMSDDEMVGVKKVLRAAGLTYVAALLTSIANLARMLLLTRRRNN